MRCLSLSSAAARLCRRGTTVCLLAPLLSGALAQQADIPVPGRSIPYWRFEARPGFGLPTPEQAIIADESSWKAFWIAAHASQSAAPPLPAVNFSREVVLVASMGRRSSTGYSISMLPLYSARGMEIQVTNKAPGKNCGTAPTETSPTDVIRIAKTSMPVTFTSRSISQDC